MTPISPSVVSTSPELVSAPSFQTEDGRTDQDSSDDFADDGRYANSLRKFGRQLRSDENNQDVNKNVTHSESLLLTGRNEHPPAAANVHQFFVGERPAHVHQVHVDTTRMLTKSSDPRQLAASNHTTAGATERFEQSRFPIAELSHDRVRLTRLLHMHPQDRRPLPFR